MPFVLLKASRACYYRERPRLAATSGAGPGYLPLGTAGTAGTRPSASALPSTAQSESKRRKSWADMPKALLTLLGAWLTHATWASMDNTSRSSSTKPGGACDSVPEAFPACNSKELSFDYRQPTSGQEM